MPSPYYYYTYPFGQNADDLTSIPTSPAVDGSVSYFYGWTDPYEYDLTTDPSALPVPRGQMNQLFYDITNNLQEYQQYGSPQWVSGNTVAYPIYARVYYSGVVYENQVAGNTVTPGTDNSWNVISANAGGVASGSVFPFAGATAPSGYLLCVGTAVSRTTYADLYDVLTQVQNGVTTNTMTSITGLTSTAQMYVGMPVEGTGIQSGTTIATIVSSSAITLSLAATASGTVPLTFFNWGNGDGATTFNVPDMRRNVPMGSGGTGTSTIGNVLGQKGGQETHTLTVNELASHTHTPLTGSSFVSNQASGGNNNLPTSGVVGFDATTGATGGSAAHNNVQPSVIFNYIIKT